MPRPLQIAAYRSYGTPRRLGVQARVLVDRGLRESTGPAGAWENLAGIYRRFHSWEVPGARVRARFGEIEQEFIADEEGYVEGWLDLGETEAHRGWNEVELTVTEPTRDEEVRATAAVMVPDRSAEFGIVSDLDDTVIATNVTKRLAMLQSVLLHNAHSRLPWEGVADLYESLCRGSDGERNNPIFYVSGGPWNLYDIYDDFLRLQKVPHGPIELSDFGFTTEVFIHPKHEEHKSARIAEILETYPELQFVLIGDSGEKDAPIYVDLAKSHPGRVRMIYIRDVTPLASRSELEALTQRAHELGTGMMLVGSTLEAWKDARGKGLLKD